VDKASWVEISLQVSPEQAEAVAEILGRFTPEGVVIEQAVLPISPSETTPDNSVKVFGYLFANAHLEDKKMRLEEALFYLGKIQALPKPTYKEIHDQNWMAAWKDQYKPLKLGNRLAILPAWAKNPFPKRVAIRINPGMAFGTGTHPTTQLCLRLMESYLKKGDAVIDVGCGSGILSIASILLDSRHAYGADISPAAIHSSKENAELNQVTERTTFQQGSVEGFLLGQFEIMSAPVVIVNILAAIILRLFDEELGDLVQPGGVLILSGILEQQADQILQKAEQKEFALLERQNMQDWVALCLKKHN